MEFAHVGRHCEMVGCKQQDFLPFKCPTCSKNLCLHHRKFSDHGCTAPDATSMDCPICKRSIVMDRSADPNIVWESHFMTSCTQQAAPQESIASKSCTTCHCKLGPSNTFLCSKCGIKVCMAHRMPDDHNCAVTRRSNHVKGISSNSGSKKSRLLDAASTSTKAISHSVGNSKSLAAKSMSHSQRSSKTSSDPGNTVAGTAHLRAERLAGSNKASHSQDVSAGLSQYTCPMCNETRASLELITQHIENDHLANDSMATNSVPAITNSISSGSEVCPQCGQRFNDIESLISHAEHAHSSNSNDSDKSNCSIT